MRDEFRFLHNKLPFYLIFYPTSRCNASCPHCFNFRRQANASRERELSLEEIDRISRGFDHIKVLTITGGEPFLRDDLVQIVSIFHKNNGVQYVSLHTNGFLPDVVCKVVAQILENLRDVQVMVCLSIDRIGEEHDRFRGLKNGFSRVLATIDGLKALQKTHGNLTLVSSTIFSHATLDSFADTVRFVQDEIGGLQPSVSFVRGSVRQEKEKAVDLQRYEDFHKTFVPEARRGLSPFSPMAVKVALEALVNRIVAANERQRCQTVPCQAGRRLVVLYEDGDVSPCETLGEKFGNLRQFDYDIRRLLSSAEARAILDRIGRQRACSCTWENIIPVNLLFSPSYYPAIFREWLRLFFPGRSRK